MSDAVNHPDHYGGSSNPYEAIKVISAWKLNFSLGNTVKYVSRAGKKDPAKEIEDLEKARFYLDWEIERLKKESVAEKPTEARLATSEDVKIVSDSEVRRRPPCRHCNKPLSDHGSGSSEPGCLGYEKKDGGL